MEKEIIEGYLLEYLKKRDVKIKTSGKVTMLECPYCHKTPMTATIPPHCNFMTCYSCGNSKKTVLDLVRDIEKIEGTNDDIIHYIKELLNLNIVTKKDKEQTFEILKFYQESGFDLVPVARDKKIPIENDWTNKEHKDITEWQRWLTDGINCGIKTGKRSNVTIIDVDVKPIPSEIVNLMGDTFKLETSKGFQFYYKYVAELPKTRINDLKIDIENDGGQCVAYPSIVDSVKRKIIALRPVAEMPPALLSYLKTKVTVPLKSFSEKLKEDIQTEDFNLELLQEGERNSSLMKLGGLLRKELNVNQTERVLGILNRHICANPITPKELTAMVRSLSKYTAFDENELAHRVISYLKDVEEAGRTEICMAIMATNKGEDKMRIDKVLNYLVKEQYILKKGRGYCIIKKLDWKDDLLEIGKPIDFKMPYFHDIAHFNYGDLILIGSKNKRGKCFAKGTGILMSDGTIKKVEEIIPNDSVMGIDSKPRKVLDIGTGEDIMYKIIPRTGESFTVNSEHILSLKTVGTDKVTNISVKDFLKQNKTFQKTHYLYRVPINFEAKEISIDPYFLGLWLGDGNSENSSVTTMDKPVKDFIYTYAEKLHLQCNKYGNSKTSPRCPTYHITKGSRGGSIDTQSKCLHSELRKLDLLNNKHIPFNYKTNTRAIRLQVLAGLIDTDGYLGYNRYEITSTNDKLTEDIVYLARSLGFYSYSRKKKTSWTYKNQKKFGVCNRILISGDIIDIPVKLKRKKAIIRNVNRNPLVTKFTIQTMKEDKYYGFTLDGDHLHLIDSFIVNHNTSIAINIIKDLVEQGQTPYYINLETGSRYAKTALKLGLKNGDFKYAFCADPTQIELEKNAITIIDWLLISDKSQTDVVFKHFIEQLDKQGGFLIVFMQLKEDNGWFAPNMVTQFPALGAKYIYDNENDGTYGKFIVDPIREPRGYIKNFEIPCKYDWNSKEFKRVQDIQDKPIKEQPSEETPKPSETKVERVTPDDGDVQIDTQEISN